VERGRVRRGVELEGGQAGRLAQARWPHVGSDPGGATLSAQVEALLQKLLTVHLPDVFNPWTDVDPMDVSISAPAARLERLRAHLALCPAVVLCGEAVGFQGCHFAGIPFTSEALLCEGAIPRCETSLRLTTRPRPWSEPSARIVWKDLYELGIAERTVLWNTFAFHPHRPGEPYTNRTPRSDEIEAGIEILRAVLGHFEAQGAAVVAVGRVADRPVPARTLRHRASAPRRAFPNVLRKYHAPTARARRAAARHRDRAPAAGSPGRA